MVDSNDSFMRELKEEIEREKFANLWNKYGTLILGGALALVLAVGGWQVWQSMAKRSAEKAGIAYQDALDKVLNRDLAAAEQGFSQLAQGGHGGYAALAKLQLAATYLEQDKPQEALTTFESLANDGRVDPLIADYARLQAAALRLGDADYSEVQNRLGGLINDQNAWRFSARELIGLAAWKAGKTEDARKMFGEIAASEDASPALRQRAEIRLTQISAGGTLPSLGVARSPPEAKAESGGGSGAKTDAVEPASEAAEAPAVTNESAGSDTTPTPGQ